MRLIALTLMLSLISASALAAIEANIGATSDYIWRGQTQTNHNAAIQGGMDYSSELGLSVGTWISNITDDTEADFYAGYSYEFNKNLALSVNYTYYHYLKNHGIDTNEVSLGLTAWSTELNAAYTDDFFGTESSAWYYSLSRSFKILPKDNISLRLSVGYSMFDDEDKVGAENYLDYKVTLAKSFETSEIGLNYTDTDQDNYDHSFHLVYSTTF